MHAFYNYASIQERDISSGVHNEIQSGVMERNHTQGTRYDEATEERALKLHV